MPICIECSYPVPQLYHVLHSSKPPVSSAAASALTSPAPASAAPNPLSPPSAAATPATVNAAFSRYAGGEAKRSGPIGADVRLMQCPRCKRFADKYVEHDFVVLFIDLVLVKPQVYRHLLFNRLGRDDNAFDPSIIRLGTLLLLFDVYLTWSAIEALPAARTAASPVPRWPILAQYAFFLLLSAGAALAQHAAVRALARLPMFRPAAEPPPPRTLGGRHGSDGPGPRPDPPGDRRASADAVDDESRRQGTPGTAPAAPTPDPEPVVVPATPTTPRATEPAAPPPLDTRATPSVAASGAASPVPLAAPTGSAVSTALFVSSCLKLFPILMVVWRYDAAGGGSGGGGGGGGGGRVAGAPSALRGFPSAVGGSAGSEGGAGSSGSDGDGGWSGVAGAGPTAVARGVAAAVAVQNLEALRTLLGVSHARAAALVAAGALAQGLVLRVALDAVGLGEGGMHALGWGGWW